MAISTKNQCQQILQHLINHGYITQLIATNYGVRRLASRIYDLKKESIDVVSETRFDDTGTKYAYYTMTAEDRAVERKRIVEGFAYAGGKRLAA